MPHVIWREGETTRKAALPRGVTSIDELVAKPFPDGTQHVVIGDDHPAAAVSISRLMIDFDSGAVDVLSPPPPVVTVDDIRAEAQRRIIVTVGARDFTDCLVRQLNANVRANELNDIRHTRALDPAEQAEADALRNLAAVIKAIRAASNVLEAASPIPADFTDNRHWLG